MISRFARGNTDLVSNRSTSARATRTGLHKDPVSREHHPNSQVSDVTEFPAPTERADVRVDFNRLIRLWRTGRLDLEGMIRKRVGLRDINQAFADMKSGDVIRTVVEI